VTPILEATGIRKAYGGVRALKGVSFQLHAGEVHALVGENGAGKSTLIKILSGAVNPDEGEIRLNGEKVETLDPHLARSLGIAVIYQQPALFPDLTVAENIALARESGKLWTRVNWRERNRHARQLLERAGAAIQPQTLVSALTMPEQQLVEIAKALDAEASVVIMDEPTASLGDQDAENLFRIVAELKSRGVGVIYISHRFEELFKLADRVTVLRDGEGLGTFRMSDMTSQELIRLMVGRPMDTVFPLRSCSPGEPILEAKHVSCTPRGVRDVSLVVRRGEVVGLAGLVGAGRTQFAETLFGLSEADGGTIELAGKPVRIGSPQEAVGMGIAYVPEDRRRHGVVMQFPIAVNTTLANLRKVSRGGFLNSDAERQAADAYVGRFRIKAPSVDTAAGDLSGGNQQKVSLARWLFTEPRLLILDEPTQGIDVGAKSEIYALIGELAAKGMAILLISSELPEVLGMSDRVVVMHAGRTVGELDRTEADAHKVLSLALGHTASVEA
jgi:rhamnose transport system ATP-binding protein